MLASFLFPWFYFGWVGWMGWRGHGHGYGWCRLWLWVLGGPTLALPRFLTPADGMGWTRTRIRTLRDVRAAMGERLAGRLASWMDARLHTFLYIYYIPAFALALRFDPSSRMLTLLSPEPPRPP
ncbi:hypothetical protein C8R45DRAFT_1013955 [Mycena sanguinolenta]|nr:hypothetical protein C8R45DRAFT_1013955 [Mycena sanguinolenta]